MPDAAAGQAVSLIGTGQGQLFPNCFRLFVSTGVRPAVSFIRALGG
jgi:hypothetical protein